MFEFIMELIDEGAELKIRRQPKDSKFLATITDSGKELVSAVADDIQSVLMTLNLRAERYYWDEL